MSEERRRRQRERTGTTDRNPMSPKMAIYLAIALLLVAGYAAYWYHNSHRYDAFAKCLATKQAKMYGLYWCPHCVEQKEKFGRSFQYVPYVECAIKGSKELAPECKAAGAKLFPSWQFDNDPPKEGVLSLDQLADKTGCSLP
jgi:hypothetical protein